MSDPPQLVLILGGARSGKSQYGERLIMRYPPPWIYVATARATDDEMHRRILEHQARRTDEWRTLEAPVDVPGTLDRSHPAPVLVDCLTLWLGNLLIENQDVELATSALEQALARRRGPVVLVSNEVGLGLVPETPLGRRFRDEAGRLHQRLASRADHVVLMVAGFPMVVKDGKQPS